MTLSTHGQDPQKREEMDNKKTNKILATATVAIALSAAIDAIATFDNFKPDGGWGIVAMIIMGLMVIFIGKLAVNSWAELRKE